MWLQGHRAFQKNVLVSSKVLPSFPLYIVFLGYLPYFSGFNQYLQVAAEVASEVIFFFLFFPEVIFSELFARHFIEYGTT